MIDRASGGVRVFDKVDGSLMTVYQYANEWHVSSSGQPDASGEVSSSGGGKTGKEKTVKTLHDLFFEVWKKLKYKLPKIAAENEPRTCFMFELFCMANPNQIKPTRDRVVLHGARTLDPSSSTNHLKEWEMSALDAICAQNGWERVLAYTEFKSLSEIVSAAQKLNGGLFEGYVVCDRHFNRIKVKSPQFVALSHMAERVGKSDAEEDGSSGSSGGGGGSHAQQALNMLHVVRASESSEFL